MARQLNTDPEIDAFVVKVIGEAQHHGAAVANIIQPLADEVRKRLVLGRDSVEVYERNGNLARTCWVTLSGNRYVFSYNYQTQQIDLRDRTLRGPLIHSFDNTTTHSSVLSVVASL
ncbi:hypothetical protein [Shimia sp. MIT910701]|uniref:hypothetical protein n=1 Tax=Shimia sp. MIT910701 TaxID=3096987 RepID=UPI00399B3892